MRQFLLLLIFSIYSLAQTLHFSLNANPSRLNPLIATDSASGTISKWIFNGLVKYDKDGNIVPDLAKSFKFLSPVELEFTLKDGVKWSDGEPFSADDVIFTYESIISPNIFTPYSSNFKEVDFVEKLDENKILVRYKTPYFKALEIWMMGILPKHLLQDSKDLMTDSFNQKPIGTGPFTLEVFELSKNIVLKSNPDYFEGKPTIDKIIFHFLPDPSTEFMMLRSKKLDLSSITPLQYKRQLNPSFHDYYKIVEDISNSYTYLGFNLNDPKFQNHHVREALSLAIDRDEIVNLLLFGHGLVCTGPFMPRTEAFNPKVPAVKKDLKRAKELLAKAGYNDENPLIFTLTTSAGGRANVAEILQNQLAQVGVQMKIRVLEWQAFLNTVILPKRFEAVLLAWSLGLKSDAYSIWHSDSIRKGGFNFVGYKNERVDFLIEKAEKVVDKEEFGEIYQEIFEIISKDLPYLFLYIPNSISVVNKNISPIEPSLVGITHNLTKWKKIF